MELLRLLAGLLPTIPEGPPKSMGLLDLLDWGGGLPGLGPIVYHGTPHKFPPTPKNPLGEFDLSKIGTGEGAQAYGHGVYLSESPSVASGYANKLSKPQVIFTNEPQTDLARALADHLRTQVGVMQHDARDWEAARLFRMMPAEVRHELGGVSVPSSGLLYRVNLPDEAAARMLDWDAPLSQQPEVVRGAAESLLMPMREPWKRSGYWPEHVTGSGLYDALAEGPGHVSSIARSGGRVAASEALGRAGIPGLKYWDQGSRAAGSGTRNYVVWQPDILEILSRE